MLQEEVIRVRCRWVGLDSKLNVGTPAETPAESRHCDAVCEDLADDVEPIRCMDERGSMDSQV